MHDLLKWLQLKRRVICRLHASIKCSKSCRLPSRQLNWQRAVAVILVRQLTLIFRWGHAYLPFGMAQTDETLANRSKNGWSVLVGLDRRRVLRSYHSRSQAGAQGARTSNWNASKNKIVAKKYCFFRFGFFWRFTRTTVHAYNSTRV